MSSVEFEDSNTGKNTYQDYIRFKSRALVGEYEKPSAFVLLEKMKVVHSEKQAYYVVLFIISACILGAVLIVYFSLAGSKANSKDTDLTNKYRIDKNSPISNVQLPPDIGASDGQI